MTPIQIVLIWKKPKKEGKNSISLPGNQLFLSSLKASHFSSFPMIISDDACRSNEVHFNKKTCLRGHSESSQLNKFRARADVDAWVKNRRSVCLYIYSIYISVCVCVCVCRPRPGLTSRPRPRAILSFKCAITYVHWHCLGRCVVNHPAFNAFSYMILLKLV